jgi:hypothetical protein
MILRLARYIFGAVLAVAVTGCASNVVMNNSDKTPAYRYNSEKYNTVSVSWSDNVAADPAKVARIRDLGLDRAIVNHLITSRLYDKQSDYSIHILVTDFRFRNAANAILFGFLSGSDNIDGVVTLAAPDSKQLAQFTVSASYALGGTGGGANESRLGWLSGKFAELTANTILNKESPTEQAGK